MKIYHYFLSALLIAPSPLLAEMSHENMNHDMEMLGTLGSYSITREASGTSWQPESTPMEGLGWKLGDWSMMTHGNINLIYDNQGGKRGDTKTFASSILMVQGSKDLGEGVINLKGMFSLDPLMGKSGYPLLFQTGETADGQNRLIDKQHPHNLFVELASSYSYPVNDKNSVFLYAGIVGEPAIGPAAFMHRLSGMQNPEAPISHHWLDSTHIANGVVTLGYTTPYWKLEGSSFHGREPDQYRYRIELGGLDSYSTRFTLNPNKDISMQISAAHIKSPETLEPTINVNRITTSITFNKIIYDGLSQTTLAFGRNSPNQGRSTNAYLLESSWKWSSNNTVFLRAEKVDKNELFLESDLLNHTNFNIKKLSIGAVHDFPTNNGYTLGVGMTGSIYRYPNELDTYYGSNAKSVLFFIRAKL
jgi:hypothetical protein